MNKYCTTLFYFGDLVKFAMPDDTPASRTLRDGRYETFNLKLEAIDEALAFVGEDCFEMAFPHSYTGEKLHYKSKDGMREAHVDRAKL